MKAHLEARQSADLKKDLAKRVMPSDGPYTKGEKVFVWHKDDNKKKSEGVWMRGTAVSQEGAMVLVQLPTPLTYLLVQSSEEGSFAGGLSAKTWAANAHSGGWPVGTRCDSQDRPDSQRPSGS